MNKSVFKIAKWVVLVMLVIAGVSFIINAKQDENSWVINNIDMKLTFSNETITCEEELSVTVGEEEGRYYNLIGDDKSFITGKAEIIYKDKTINDILTGGYVYMLQKTANELQAKTGEQIKIKLLYKIEASVLQRHKDRDVLSLGYLDTKKLKVTLVPYTTITDVSVKNGEVIENNGMYEISFDNLKSDEINIEGKFNDVGATEYYDYEEMASSDCILGVMIFTLCCLIGVIINNKKKKTNEYKRDVKDLISPSLAELIIDGKIDMKNLIMSTIIELELKGNAKIINSNEIELVSMENLTGVQKSMVQLLFNSEKGTIKLSDINEIFLKSKEKTKIFSKNLENVKRSIINILTATNYISKNRMRINRVLKIIAVLNCATIFFLFSGLNVVTDIIPIILTFGLPAVFIAVNTNHGIRFHRSSGIIRSIIVSFSCAIFIALTVIVKLNLLMYGWSYLLIAIVVLIINLIIIKKSKQVILSDEGEEMRLELLKLKRYLEDYSVINERDLKSVVIWDEYLAYATAFGMSSNITKQIYECWYNINITLQMVSQFL